MRTYLQAYWLVLLIGLAIPGVRAQELVPVMEDLQAGDVVVFQEVQTGCFMSNGGKANLVTYDPNSTNIQFIVEGNVENGYQFLVKSTSDGVADNHATDESYLSGGTNAWDVLVKAYDDKCTWTIVPAEKEGIYKIRNNSEAEDNYIGVNYSDKPSYPLWRDKAGFPFDNLTEESTYGVFWNIYKISIKSELDHWMTIFDQCVEDLGIDANGFDELQEAFDAAQEEMDSPESTKETVEQAVTALKEAIFTFLIVNASKDKPLDITRYVMENADMENGTVKPWVNATNRSDFHTEPVNANISTHLSGSFLQTWNNTNDAAAGKTGKICQLIKGLPNGLYTLQAAYTEMWEGQEEDQVIETGTNVYLYGGSRQTELVIDKLSRFGFPETGGRVATVEDVQVTDGTLEVGVRYEGAHMTVSALDNVILYYKGFDTSAMIEELSNQIGKAKSTLIGKKMQTIVADRLNTAITGAEQAVADVSSSKEDLELAGVELGKAVTDAGASVKAYETFEAAIQEANEFYQMIESGDASALKTALDEALAMYEDATAEETVLSETIEGLRKAVWDFQIANASAGNPLDMTSLVKNADMEQRDPVGWINDTNITDFHTEPVNGNFTLLTGYFLQTWNNTADAEIGKTGRIYQTLTDLPNGYYTLTAAYTEMWEGQEEDQVIETGTNVYLYGNSGQTELVIDKLSRFGFPETGGRLATVDDIQVTDGTLEIGVRYEGAHMTVSALDNVLLYYKGVTPDATEEISADRKTDTSLKIFSVEGGVRIESAGGAVVMVYTESGQFLKAEKITEGSNYLSLPAGKYIICNRVCIVL